MKIMEYKVDLLKTMTMKKYISNVLDYLIDFVEKYYFVFLTIVLLLTIYNLFLDLRTTPINSWDEARHGVSAFEMLKRNDFIVNTFAYKNDYWNLKPPISFWAIMLGYKLVGFNPLGLRLFSALASFCTILIVALFVKHKYGGVASVISALILTTSPQYILYHGARTGDADALFVLFFTISIIAMALIERNIKWLYIAGLGFSLAFLTKSWHALNIAIIIGLYLLLTKRIFKLKLKEWAGFLLSSLLPILVWGIFRYIKDGLTFIIMMFWYDLFARSAKSIEGHTGGYGYYIYLLEKHYILWLQLLGIAFLIYLVINKDKFFKNIFKRSNFDISKITSFLAISLWIVIPLLTFSKAQTKIGWYILPLYPPLAIIIGILCGKLLAGKKRIVLAQLIIIIYLFQGLYIYEPFIKKRIETVNQQGTKVTLQNFRGFGNFKGSKAYISTGYKKIYWRQSDLLTAELYGDLRPVTGGLPAFLKDKNQNSILIAPKSDKYAVILEKNKLKVVAQSKYVYFLRKQDVRHLRKNIIPRLD